MGRRLSVGSDIVTAMDAEFAALTTAAATTIVKLLATSAWQPTKNAVVALWRKVHPGRAGRIERDLDEDRAQLAEAAAQGDERVDAIGAALADEWRGRLNTLLTIDPGLAVELRRLLDDQLRPALGGAGATTAGSVEQHATASKHSTVIQAGGAVNITGPLHQRND